MKGEEEAGCVGRGIAQQFGAEVTSVSGSVLCAKASSVENAAVTTTSATEAEGDACAVGKIARTNSPEQTRRNPTKQGGAGCRSRAGRSCGWRLISETGTCNKQLLPSFGAHAVIVCARYTGTCLAEGGLFT